jgi:hypothetical protein
MNRNIFILLIAISISGCALFKNSSDLNPLEYNFNAPIKEVRKEVIEQLSEGKYRGLPLQEGYDETEMKYFKLSELELDNRNHFFLNKSGEISTGKSEYYRSFFGKMLEVYPFYHIVLDSISENQTNLKIISVPRVIRQGIDTNHGIPIHNTWKAKVKPFTIEEYQLIKYIGEAVGEENMPEVKRKRK